LTSTPGTCRRFTLGLTNAGTPSSACFLTFVRPTFEKYGDDAVGEVVTAYQDSDGTPKFHVLLPDGSILDCYISVFTVVVNPA